MDAKIFAMIDDLSRGALVDLLGGPYNPDNSHFYLISAARQQYETGHISESDIVSAWEDEDAE